MTTTQTTIQIGDTITGRDRTAYYRRKLAEVLTESGIRVSLVAELDGQFAQPDESRRGVCIVSLRQTCQRARKRKLPFALP